jgi:hypothetical protein
VAAPSSKILSENFCPIFENYLLFVYVLFYFLLGVAPSVMTISPPRHNTDTRCSVHCFVTYQGTHHLRTSYFPIHVSVQYDFPISRGIKMKIKLIGVNCGGTAFLNCSTEQGCQIFLGMWYQNRKKCTKSTLNVPNGHKISQMSMKYYKRK